MSSSTDGRAAHVSDSAEAAAMWPEPYHSNTLTHAIHLPVPVPAHFLTTRGRRRARHRARHTAQPGTNNSPGGRGTTPNPRFPGRRYFSADVTGTANILNHNSPRYGCYAINSQAFRESVQQRAWFMGGLCRGYAPLPFFM